MSEGAKLEILNLTDRRIQWAHLEPVDGPRMTPRNLLQEDIAPSRGRLLESMEHGRMRLVCGFERGPAGTAPEMRVGDPVLDLVPDAALSVRVERDGSSAYRFGVRDAAIYTQGSRGMRKVADLYTWSTIAGQHTKA